MYIIALNILNGPRAGHKIWLKPRQWVVVGRTELSDFSISSDPTLSQTHFRLNYPNADDCRLEDLRSTNGTYVNEKPIVQCRLANGDTIVAGNTVFRVNLLN